MNDKRIIWLAFLIFLILWSNDIKLNDEYLIIGQLKSVSNLRFDITVGDIFIYQGTPYFTFKGLHYASFSHSLAIVSLPLYILFSFISNYIYFTYFLNWMFIFTIGILFMGELKKPIPFLTFVLVSVAILYTYTPLFNQEDWIPLYSIKLTNIILAISTAVILTQLLADLHLPSNTQRICFFLLLFATPIAYWTLTAKHHALSVFIISLVLFLINRYEKEKDNKKLHLLFLIAGLLVWIRPLDGVTLITSLLIYSIYKTHHNRIREFLIKVPIYLSLFFVGYLPGFVIGMHLFNNPLPLEIYSNLIAGTSYVRFSNLKEVIFEFPYIFVGINDKTLGIFSYSPVFGLLFSNLFQRKLKMSIKQTYHNLKDFEKFIVLFSTILFLVYLPTLKSGVINTEIHDYRFYLPLMLPMVLFLSKILKKHPLDFLSFLKYFLLNFSILFTTIIICITVTKASFYFYFNYLYLLISSTLFVLYIIFDRFSIETKTALLSLSLLPTSFIFIDSVVGYYGPFDIHFVISPIDYLIKRLVVFFGWM